MIKKALTLFSRYFHLQELIFVLSLMALACLPIALSELIRDAGTSLLLPLTLYGSILAWVLTSFGVRKSLSGIALLFLGPLALYIRIGGLGNSLFEFIRQILKLIPAFYGWLFYETNPDFSLFLAARIELIEKTLAFSGRLSFWFASITHGIKIEDPLVPTFLWSMFLWLIAIWAGWQIYRNKRFMTGMLPSTVLLIFVLDYTGEEKTILWLHLALLLFLFGLTNYHNLQSRWSISRTDYAESISFDTLAVVGVITIGLVFTSFLVFNVSIKDILDKFREKRPGISGTHTELFGLQAAKESYSQPEIGGLPRSHLLRGGPELSKQLAMTVSTGDLPPMPLNANPNVPRYYWRSSTYANYNGFGWSNPSVTTEAISADQALVKTSNPNYRIIHTQVTFPNDANKRLFWTGVLVSADVPFKAAWTRKTENGSLLNSDLLAAMTTVTSYKAESALLNVKVQELRNSSSVYPDWVRKRFLTLPDSVPERVLGLARDLTASEPTAYDRALAIQTYLRKYPYTLDIPSPPASRDVVDYFLFDLKKGYCDYYATSMVVLARAAGLPARLVVGYANGAYNTERAEYIVTENYAHSWVEIYFTNIGWVQFEPTASEPAIFYEEKNEFPAPIVAASPIKSFINKEQFSAFFEGIYKNSWFPLLFIFSSSFLWVRFDSLRLHKISPSQTIELLYKRLRRLARPVTGTASRNQTAHSYSFALAEKISSIKTSSNLQNWLRLSQSEIHQLTELFSHSLFSSHTPSRAEANTAIKTWSRLRWRLILANILKFKKHGQELLQNKISSNSEGIKRL